MNSMPITLQTSAKPQLKASELKAGENITNDSVDFSKVLNSVTAIPTEVQPNAYDQQKEMLAKLETLLTSLEQLPKEELAPEQQEMLQAIMELMGQQLQQPEAKIQTAFITPEETKPLEQSPLIEQASQKELLLTEPAIETLASNRPHQSQLIDLLEEAVEVLQKLTDTKAKESGTSDLSVDTEKLKQILNQLASLIEELNTGQQKAETEKAAVQVQQLEKVLKQVTGLKQEPINLIQSKEIQQPVAMPHAEKINEVQAAPKPQEPTVPAIPAEQSQAASSGLEIAKSNPTPQRQETNVPQATVRFSNLVEDLGETLRGSFRLNGEGDTKQIKISIFPEHLGQMDIRLTSIDGKIVAQIFTSTLAAKEALDQQASLLRGAMAQQGISVEKIEITQQSSPQSFGQQFAHPDQRFSQQQKQGTANRNRNGYQRTEEDAVIVRQQSNDGALMKVDYTI